MDDDPRLIDGHRERRDVDIHVLWVELQSVKLMNEHLKSLACLLLKSAGGAATYPVETLKGLLGATFESTFNEEKTEITFTVKEEDHDPKDEERLQSTE